MHRMCLQKPDMDVFELLSREFHPNSAAIADIKI